MPWLDEMATYSDVLLGFVLLLLLSAGALGAAYFFIRWGIA